MDWETDGPGIPGGNSFFLIAGPCAIEGEDISFHIASTVRAICNKLGIPYIFKGSFRKANRSRGDSFSGIGDNKALDILKGVKESFNIPVLTDIHTEADAQKAAAYVDMLQIPAFLCRQTSLLEAAAKTGLPVNIKKGQFLSPGAMEFAVEKIRQAGNNKVMVTERGTTFGYGDLVVDFRSVPTMQAFDVPVVLDCTHSLQRPNQESGVTGGDPKFIETIARAGISICVNGLFVETHPEPAEAKSDGANMLKLDLLEPMLERLTQVDQLVRNF